MNLQIGKVKSYNNKILISLPSFIIGSNVKINLDKESDKPDVKPKAEPNIKSSREHKQDVKPKPNIEFNNGSKPDKITYEEEKVALVLGITAVFTVWWMFK